ncbi:MAG: hypothetical protein ABL967_20200, partial [Bryobacteraceae bacterium]
PVPVFVQVGGGDVGADGAGGRQAAQVLEEEEEATASYEEYGGGRGEKPGEGGAFGEGEDLLGVFVHQEFLDVFVCFARGDHGGDAGAEFIGDGGIVDGEVFAPTAGRDKRLVELFEARVFGVVLGFERSGGYEAGKEQNVSQKFHGGFSWVLYFPLVNEADEQEHN